MRNAMKMMLTAKDERQRKKRLLNGVMLNADGPNELKCLHGDVSKPEVLLWPDDGPASYCV